MTVMYVDQYWPDVQIIDIIEWNGNHSKFDSRAKKINVVINSIDRHQNGNRKEKKFLPIYCV